MIKLIFSLFLLVVGVLTAWRYLRPALISQSTPSTVVGGDRPWRRLGAGIMLVICVMFVAGIYVVDIPDRPRIYATYWLVLFGLLFWLCTLAIKDARHTRKFLLQSRMDHLQKRRSLQKSNSFQEG